MQLFGDDVSQGIAAGGDAAAPCLALVAAKTRCRGGRPAGLLGDAAWRKRRDGILEDQGLLPLSSEVEVVSLAVQAEVVPLCQELKPFARPGHVEEPYCHC